MRPPPPDDELDALLERSRARLRLRHRHAAMGRGAAVGLALGALLAIADGFLLLPFPALPSAIALAALGSAIGAALAARRRVGLYEVAAGLDRLAGSRELLSTTWYLRGRGDARAAELEPEARRVAAQLDPAALFPEDPTRPLVEATVGAALLVVGLTLPLHRWFDSAPSPDALAHVAAVASDLERSSLELAHELEDSGRMEEARIAERVAEASSRLADGRHTARDALRELADLEEELAEAHDGSRGAGDDTSGDPTPDPRDADPAAADGELARAEGSGAEPGEAGTRGRSGDGDGRASARLEDRIRQARREIARGAPGAAGSEGAPRTASARQPGDGESARSATSGERSSSASPGERSSSASPTPSSSSPSSSSAAAGEADQARGEAPRQGGECKHGLGGECTLCYGGSGEHGAEADAEGSGAPEGAASQGSGEGSSQGSGDGTRAGPKAGFGVTDEAGPSYATGAPEHHDASGARRNRWLVDFQEGDGSDPGLRPRREEVLTLGLDPSTGATVTTEEVSTARAGDRAVHRSERGVAPAPAAAERRERGDRERVPDGMQELVRRYFD